VRNPRELDDQGPSPVPEVRAMNTANGRAVGSAR
jgi:hypothetical protein